MIDASPELSIRFKDLFSPSTNHWLDLFNNKKVRRHMPLAEVSVDADWINNWINHKVAASENSPFKIHSIWINGNFAGWAGIQVDNEDYELAIVLSPNYWGAGKILFQKLINEFEDSEVDKNLYIYLPLTRNTRQIAERFNLEEIGYFEPNNIGFTKLKINVGGEGFVTYI